MEAYILSYIIKLPNICWELLQSAIGTHLFVLRVGIVFRDMKDMGLT